MNVVSVIVRLAFGFSVLCLAPFAPQANAQSQSEQDDWEYTLAPYAFLIGVQGKAASIPGVPPADVDVSFSDFVKNADAGLLLYGDARKGRYGIMSDFIWGKLSSKSDAVMPLFGELKLKARILFWSLAGTYRLYDDDGSNLDTFAGFRLWNVSTRVNLSEGILAARTVGGEETWLDPWIGLRGRVPLGPKFFASGTAAIGGFSISSDLSWEVLANIGYRWNAGFETTLGYRILAVDFEKSNGFLYDVEHHGLNLGFVFRF